MGVDVGKYGTVGKIGLGSRKDNKGNSNSFGLQTLGKRHWNRKETSELHNCKKGD